MKKCGEQSVVRLILRTMWIQFTTTPFHTTMFLFIILLEALGLTARTISTQNLFDTILDASDGNADFEHCMILVLIMGIITILQQLFNGVKFFYLPVITDKTSGKNLKKLFEKIQRISPEAFENTDFLDGLNKAQEGVKAVTNVPLYVLNIIFFDITYAISMSRYLFDLSPVLITTLAFAFVPALISQFVQINYFSKLEKQSAPLRRRCDYYNKAICEREYFKETRMIGAFDYFYDLFCDTLSLLLHKQWETERKATLVKLLLNLGTFIGMGLSTYLLFIATIDGIITIGAFAAVFATLGQVFDIMQSMMTWDISGITRDLGKVYNFMETMDYPEVTGEKRTQDLKKGIVANNIYFAYPERSEFAIDNVSLKIKKGETIAIVGENGSGKSTLIRLLTGLYRPCQGDVVIAGINTKDVNLDSLYQGISGVFQNYQRYKMTLLENVIISDIKKTVDELEVINVLKKSGVDGSGKDDIDLSKMLSPEFGGIDLSGGQWQRLAIARALYRDSVYIVLDEPTAAIDPIEEDKLYTKFKELVEDKSAIIVTHRLGSTKLADRIIVMDKGKIVDIGTHEQLLFRSGKYANMWQMQAVWYERNAVN